MFPSITKRTVFSDQTMQKADVLVRFDLNITLTRETTKRCSGASNENRHTVPIHPH
jgi:hypothetical protein